MVLPGQITSNHDFDIPYVIVENDILIWHDVFFDPPIRINDAHVGVCEQYILRILIFPSINSEATQCHWKWIWKEQCIVLSISRIYSKIETEKLIVYYEQLHQMPLCLSEDYSVLIELRLDKYKRLAVSEQHPAFCCKGPRGKGECIKIATGYWKYMFLRTKYLQGFISGYVDCHPFISLMQTVAFECFQCQTIFLE